MKRTKFVCLSQVLLLFLSDLFTSNCKDALVQTHPLLHGYYNLLLLPRNRRRIGERSRLLVVFIFFLDILISVILPGVNLTGIQFITLDWLKEIPEILYSGSQVFVTSYPPVIKRWIIEKDLKQRLSSPRHKVSVSRSHRSFPPLGLSHTQEKTFSDNYFLMFFFLSDN